METINIFDSLLGYPVAKNKPIEPKDWNIKICPNSHNHVSEWPDKGLVECPDCRRLFVKRN